MTNRTESIPTGLFFAGLFDQLHGVITDTEMTPEEYQRFLLEVVILGGAALQSFGEDIQPSPQVHAVRAMETTYSTLNSLGAESGL